MKGFIVGMVKKLKRTSTDLFGFIIGLLQTIKELEPKGYKLEWIEKAIRKTLTRKEFKFISNFLNQL